MGKNPENLTIEEVDNHNADMINRALGKIRAKLLKSIRAEHSGIGRLEVSWSYHRITGFEVTETIKHK